MPQDIEFAPLDVRLMNCACWHQRRADMAEHRGERSAAERHSRLAFRLFKQAHLARQDSADQQGEQF